MLAFFVLFVAIATTGFVYYLQPKFQFAAGKLFWLVLGISPILGVVHFAQYWAIGRVYSQLGKIWKVNILWYGMDLIVMILLGYLMMHEMLTWRLGFGVALVLAGSVVALS